MSNRGENLMRKFQSVVLVSLTAMFCLFSTAYAAAQTTISATTVNFGNVAENTTSATKTVTLKNTGATSITINSLSMTAGTPYAIAATSTCLSPTLAAGKSCTVGLTLSPVTLGAQPAGTLTINTTASNPTTTVGLSGTGVVPVVLTATGFNFGVVAINTTSSTKSLGVINNLPTPLSFTSISASAGFSVVPGGSCSTTSTVATGASCNILVAFAPTTLGAQTGTLTLADNSPDSPQTMTLSGTGAVPVVLTATGFNFGVVAINTTSATKSLGVINNLPTPLSFTSISASAGFSVVPGGSCSTTSTVASRASCNILVAFAPTTLGAQTGTLTLADNSPDSPQTMTLSGTGVFPG